MSCEKCEIIEIISSNANKLMQIFAKSFREDEKGGILLIVRVPLSDQYSASLKTVSAISHQLHNPTKKGFSSPRQSIHFTLFFNIVSFLLATTLCRKNSEKFC